MKIRKIIALALIFVLLFTTFKSYGATNTADNLKPKNVEQVKIVDKPQQKTSTVNEGANISQEDIELIALVTMAEAEGESEEGKRLVIDTILNRMDSDIWPDTAYGVIYQPNQFEAMWNGRVDRCYVRDDICQLVIEELRSRTNNEVVFFMAGDYSTYGTPLFQVGNHYFSSY